MSALLLDARGVTRSWRVGEAEIHALRGVDLQVPTGSWVALVGASGSGKSTLLAILGCLDRPTSGTYRLADQAVEDLPPRALAQVRNRTIGFVFQSFQLLERLRADENVALPLRYAGWPRARRLARARELLDVVGLADRAAHTPLELSGGQCQRVAIARALATDPPLLLADEPTGNLDTRTGAEILALLERLHAEGRTIVLVTHDEHIAARSPRRVRIQDGRIVEDTALPALAEEG